MAVSFTPQIFISYIPDGKIKFEPQLYATVILAPHVEKVSADTSRDLRKIEKAAADTLREVGNFETARADLSRKTKNLERAVADTARKIGLVIVSADTCRVVKNVEKVEVSTLREVGIAEKISADSLRKVAVFEKISADSFLKITASEKVFADTCRRMLDRASADSLRKVVRPEKFSADTVIRYPHVLNFIAQEDSLINSFADYQATLFEVTLNERTLSDSFTLETARQININDAVQGIFLDYPYNFLVEEINQRDLISSVKGMYDVDKLLYSFIEMDLRGTANAVNFISGIAQHLGLTPNVKIENFTPYNVLSDSNMTYSDLISGLFSWTSRLPQRQINVFIRGKTLHCIQRGLEDSVFDISDIPHSRPTVNKKLIRSMYNNPFADNDFSDETYDDPYSGTITYSDSYGGTNSIAYRNGLLISELTRTYNQKVEATNKSTYEYQSFRLNGEDKPQYYLKKKVVESTTIETEGEVSIGQYGSFAFYDNDRTKTVTQATSEYIYSTTSERAIESGDDGELHYIYKTEIYLRKEYETNLKVEYFKRKKSTAWQETDRETNDRQTLHSPAGNGWYATTVFENGEYIGSSISQGAPSNQVSQYTTQQIRRIFGKLSDDPEERYEQLRSKLAPIADISFPVRELDLIQELTRDLLWLNRKTQITVSVDLISKIEKGVPELKHIVDFTERVKFDGAEYFLVSNQISFTPRKLIQKLQLVRWTD